MEYGNGRATMIELDMVYVSYFGDFLSIGSRESFEQNILFRLSPPRKAASPAGIACRPGPALIWKPPLRPLRNTAPNHGATFPVTCPAPFTSSTPFIVHAIQPTARYVSRLVFCPVPACFQQTSSNDGSSPSYTLLSNSTAEWLDNSLVHRIHY